MALEFKMQFFRNMFHVGVIAWLVGGLVWPALAQTPIYRCGNEYTNNPGDAKARGCRLVEGGNLTIVEGFKPKAGDKAGDATKPAKGNGATAGARNANEKVDSAEQRARDSDARAILEMELRKAEARVQDLRAQYNNGEPEKQGIEFRNHQLYLDRVAQLKANLERAQADVDGIKRELARTAPAPTR